MKKVTLWLAAAAIFFPLMASAADFTWNTGASGSISDGSNWSGEVSPFDASGTAATGNITISSGTPTYTALSLSGDAALSVSGITAITAGGNVTLSGSSSLTLGNASWKLTNTSIFQAGASAGTSNVTLQSGASLDTSAKGEGFVLVPSGVTSTVNLTIESGATLRTYAAQLARGSQSNVTVDVYGTWTNTGGGRLGENGTTVINVHNGGAFAPSGYISDQGNGLTTVNVESGGRLLETFSAVATRGRAIVNIQDGASWTYTGTQVIGFGANSRTHGTVYQTGGTVSGPNVRFGSDNTAAATAGGKGEYILNGGTLTLSGSMSQFDMATAKPGARNVVGTLYLGYTTDYAPTSGSGVATIGTMTNTLLNANEGTLYTTSFAQKEGVSTIQGTASVNIQDTLPATPAAGSAGLHVNNANLLLTGTAELDLVADATNHVNAYIGNTSVTLNDSAKIKMTNTAYSTVRDNQYFYLSGEDGSTSGSLTLNDSATMEFDGSFLIAGSTDAQNPSVITLNDNSRITVTKGNSPTGYLQLGGKYGAYAGHAKLVLNGNSQLQSSGTGVQVAPMTGSTVEVEVNDNALWTLGASSRVGDNGTLTLNLNGGKVQSSGFYFADSVNGKAYVNVQGGTLEVGGLTLATRGAVEMTISDGLVTSTTIYAAHLQGGTNQKVNVTQTGGTLNTNNFILYQPKVAQIPTYTISGGTATIANDLYGIDINYLGGELNVKNLYIAKDIIAQAGSTVSQKYVENTLNIQLSDEYDPSQFTVENLFGEGTLNISTTDGYDFDPNAQTTLFTLINPSDSLDGIRLTNSLGLPTDGWMLLYDGSSVILTTPGSFSSIPEPASWVLLALGLLGMARLVSLRGKRQM
ncbi:MAG: PEP-CTERM sorting domain-containing protein [Thermoguttaceae bacterium]|nr:PEP-CTERM sorting domain-containing protein [Thermoguttaceae bacterium]